MITPNILNSFGEMALGTTRKIPLLRLIDGEQRICPRFPDYTYTFKICKNTLDHVLNEALRKSGSSYHTYYNFSSKARYPDSCGASG
jgi:hypothetical protein